jgi:hypothetical protein
MRRAALALLVPIFAISFGPSARSVEPHNMTAKELLFACSSAHDSNDYPVCLVFMNGFDAGAKATLATVPWCLPPDLTMEESILAFVRVMHTHPQLLTEKLSIAVGAALVTAYPCHPEAKK